VDVNVCVVGSGPTAEGKGDIIDACDFVVRLKQCWADGAENAGSACHAIADYDYPPERCDRAWCPWPDAEFWLTHTPSQIIGERGTNYLETITVRRDLGIIRWVSTEFVVAIRKAVGYFPSTGVVAICMAMRLLHPDVLTIVGFDQLTPAEPNFDCARRKVVDHPDLGRPSHDFVAEKRFLARLEDGTWLGEECQTKLVWIDKPDIPPIAVQCPESSS
jgi:hypothetical protein